MRDGHCVPHDDPIRICDSLNEIKTIAGDVNPIAASCGKSDHVAKEALPNGALPSSATPQPNQSGSASIESSFALSEVKNSPASPV